METELSDMRKGLSDVKEIGRNANVQGCPPGVSLIVISDGDSHDQEAFEAHLATSSMADLEVIYVHDIFDVRLEKVTNDYVAIVRVTDRYVNDYALEVLVNTAKLDGADVVGGITAKTAEAVSDFVFDSSWLREHEYLLGLLKSGAQAFLAAAIARSRKHIVNNRVYSESVRAVATPLVSVVVPAYNAECYLDRCLESLVSQTHSHLEIIVVNDGSTDSTADIANRWEAKDNRIKVIHKQNGGLSSARNAGMRVAQGKYIGFVDADDYVDIDMFGHMAEVLECHPYCDVAKCGVDVEYTYKVSPQEKKSTQAYFEISEKGEVRPGFDVVNMTDVCAVDKLYRVDFLRDNGIVFPEGVKNEDEAFFFAVFCRIRNCFYLPQRYYHYLRNDAGIMAKQKAAAEKGEIPDAVMIYAYVAELLERENRRDLLGVLYRHMVGFVQRFLETPIEDAVSDLVAEILSRTRAFYYADLINGADRQWVLRRVYELMNRMRSGESSHVVVPNEWFPSTPPPQIGVHAHPIVSFIVPVYNAEKYISVALETLRRQTLSDFEVICVDDGSIDDSGKILDFYSRIDPRIKVWHLENGGVSRARNFGLEKACGRYVAFFDGDDRLHPRMAARTVLLAANDDLDSVLFDYRCFAYDSLKPIDHYWRLAKHIGDFPQDKVFAPAELARLMVYGSSCTFLWDREFLHGIGVSFLALKLGEDLVWVLSVLPKVRRMRVCNVPFYEYRRGNPTSAVSRLQGKTSDAPVLAVQGLADVIAQTEDRQLRVALLKRMIADIIFFAEKTPRVCSWFQNGGIEAFGGAEFLKRACPDQKARIDELLKKDLPGLAVDIEYFIRQAPQSIQVLMHSALVARRTSEKDVIIVAGQLNSTTNESIDSWTFFRWLQDHGIPSRYVIWRKHCMVNRIREDSGLKDVILLSGNGVDNFEFIEKCSDLLPRLKAVVMENTALNPLTWRYFHMLEECSYIFLQHGVMFWKMAPKLASAFAVANYVNVASVAEKEFLEAYVPEHWETGRKPRYLIAGLPRWDLLKDESGEESEKVVFYMPTWRAAFNSGMDTIAQSAYFAGVRSLVNEENLERLKKKNIRLVMAAHHHLVNHVKNLDFNLPIELVPTSEISYWIRHASLCITDYSSVSFDFLFLNKPCIFWTPDRYDGLLHGDDYAEVVFAEHQGMNMFNRVQTVEEVLEMIEKYADSGFELEPEKRMVSERYFSYHTNVCARLYEQISAIDTGLSGDEDVEHNSNDDAGRGSNEDVS